ncbi:hypothetical protein FSP39_018354 [Pinctada imbricata]|uniref:Uncharacterized protein n=1 Tax=Pinctada imbricata TaxID=66713 RepID=A0AA88XMY3_PINIB|nr:hypothetical protein FSP39_018354 [Pinctada imbricata]
MGVRVGLDWISCLVQLVAAFFFTLGFGTDYWSSDTSGDIHGGLFTTCSGDYCYDTHVYYNELSEKGKIMGTAVLQIFTLCGVIFVLLFMLLYMCALFDELYLGRASAMTAYITALLGFISIIIYGSAISGLQYSLGWSCGLNILGLILNTAAGVCIQMGSKQWVELKEKSKRVSNIPPPPLKKRVAGPLPPPRMDPRLEPRVQSEHRRSSNKFSPKASPKLPRKGFY